MFLFLLIWINTFKKVILLHRRNLTPWWTRSVLPAFLPSEEVFHLSFFESLPWLVGFALIPLLRLAQILSYIFYFWPSASDFLSGSPDSNRLVALLIHTKVGSSLQEDFRQLNFVFNAALMSQDIMSDQPSALPRRILIQFLLFWWELRWK